MRHMIFFNFVNYFRSKFIIKPNKATQMEGKTHIHFKIMYIGTWIAPDWLYVGFGFFEFRKGLFPGISWISVGLDRNYFISAALHQRGKSMFISLSLAKFSNFTLYFRLHRRHLPVVDINSLLTIGNQRPFTSDWTVQSGPLIGIYFTKNYF